MLTSILICTLAPLALSLGGPLATDDLLPATPEGWRYERLDLPLEFAPDLPYKGFEELRFAPGMFTAGAEDYWSYVFAIQTAEPARLGAAELTTLLSSYYGGLCEAVASGNDFDFDRSDLAVAVEDHGDRYVATVDLVDVFVTGKPLTVRLELLTFHGAETSEILGIASPADADAEIWNTLHGVADKWRDARAPEVFLNHLFFSPDAETYAALLAAPVLLQGFAAREERTTTRPDMAYTGIYFYGHDTYFEFLKPTDSTADEVGSTGVALGLERDGATTALKARLMGAGIPCFDEPKSRELGAVSLPWFHAMGLQQAHVDSSMVLFTVEYDERFLAGWHNEQVPKLGGITRRQVLTRYAAALDQSSVHREGLLQDITEVHLALDEREQKSFEIACEQFGYVRRASTAGAEWLGPGIKYVISPSSRPGGLTGFRATLRRDVETQTLRLGKAVLHLEGRSATFSLPR